MKNISLALNGVLIIAVAILYYLQFSGDNNSTPEITNEVTIPEEEISEEENVDVIPSKIGYLNVDSLQKKSKLYTELINKLKAREKKYEKELNGKMAALENKVRDFQQKASSMTQFEGQTKQKELMEEEQRLYKMRDDFMQKFQNEEIKLGQQFQKELQDFIDEYNKERDFNIVIGASVLGNTVLHHNKGIDISDDVINGLNDQYDKKKEEKNKEKNK